MRVGLGELDARCLIFRRPNPGRICRLRWPPCVTRTTAELAFYIDTSALVKLVVAEPESDALRAWFADSERDPVACDLARTELLRAVRRAAPDRLVQARAVLDAVTLLEVTTQIFEAAGPGDGVGRPARGADDVAGRAAVPSDADGSGGVSTFLVPSGITDRKSVV